MTAFLDIAEDPSRQVDGREAGAGAGAGAGGRRGCVLKGTKQRGPVAGTQGTGSHNVHRIILLSCSLLGAPPALASTVQVCGRQGAAGCGVQGAWLGVAWRRVGTSQPRRPPSQTDTGETLVR